MGSTKLQDLLVDELRDLLSAERQLTKGIPAMAKAASAPELRGAFETHLTQTQGHVERLEQALGELGLGARAKKCVAMEGLIGEAKSLIEEGMAPEVLDAALVAAAQKVEHYEIATYGSARAWARQLGQSKVEKLLDQTLQEESETNEKLTSLAEEAINPKAA